MVTYNASLVVCSDTEEVIVSEIADDLDGEEYSKAINARYESSRSLGIYHL